MHEVTWFFFFNIISVCVWIEGLDHHMRSYHLILRGIIVIEHQLSLMHRLESDFLCMLTRLVMDRREYQINRGRAIIRYIMIMVYICLCANY